MHDLIRNERAVEVILVSISKNLSVVSTRNTVLLWNLEEGIMHHKSDSIIILKYFCYFVMYMNGLTVTVT